MIINIDKADLLYKLSKIESAIKDKISLYSENKILFIEAANNEFAGRVKLTKIDRELTNINVSPLLVQIIKKMPDDTIILDISAKKIKIQSGGCISIINTLDSVKANINFEQTGAINLSIPNLKKLLKKVLISVKKNNSDILSGVHFKKNDDGLTIEATDCFRYSRIKVSLDNISDVDVTIPGLTLSKVLQVVDSNEMIFKYSENQVLIEDALATWIFSIHKDKFPNMESLVPTKFQQIYVTNKEYLLNSLDRASLYNGLEDDALVFQLEPNKSIISKTSSIGVYEDVIEMISSEGDSTKVGLSNKYLADALKQLDADEVKIKCNGSLKPIILCSNSDDEREIQLILPIRID